MKQRDIFLESEANAWFERNAEAVGSKQFHISDPVIQAVAELSLHPDYKGKRLKILEIGCGEASRLAWMAQNFSLDIYGIDPSSKAVEVANKKGIHAVKATAEDLPFDSDSFDVVIFGFCLYLCDREDLFRIAQEADRVLKTEAWIVIHDFFSPQPIKRVYQHKHGVYSFKMDYRKLFEWHPSYICLSHQVNHHGGVGFTDDSVEWVATSIVRKSSRGNE